MLVTYTSNQEYYQRLGRKTENKKKMSMNQKLRYLHFKNTLLLMSQTLSADHQITDIV